MAISAIKSILKGLDEPNTAAKAAKGATTATGKAVDLSKGYVVKGLNGQVIPFRPNTPLEKAKEWTKNFYNRQFERRILSESEDENGKLEQIAFDSKAKTMAQRDEGAFEESVVELMAMRDERQYQIRHSYVSEKERGKGHAAGAYRHLFELAKNEGRLVISDSRLSPEAVAIWERFRELGYPVIAYPRVKRTENGVTEYVRAGVDRTEDLPLYEFDPIGRSPDIKPQAGQTPADRTGPKTDMFIEKQAE